MKDALDALKIIVREDRKEQVTKTGLRRLQRACKILKLNEAETLAFLTFMDYDTLLHKMAQEAGEQHLSRISTGLALAGSEWS